MPAIDLKLNYCMQRWQNPSDAPRKCKWDKLHFIGHKKLMVSALRVLLLFYSLSIWLHQVNKLHENMMRGEKKPQKVTAECVHKCKLHLTHLDWLCKKMHNYFKWLQMLGGYNPCCTVSQLKKHKKNPDVLALFTFLVLLRSINQC